MTEYRQTKRAEEERAEQRLRESRSAPPPPPAWDEVDWDTWNPQSGNPPPRPRSGPDLSPLFALIDVMRSAMPRELRAQFNALVREILLTLRALIDWYLERLDGGRKESRIEDIPIE
jgi:hypothetical protein